MAFYVNLDIFMLFLIIYVLHKKLTYYFSSWLKKKSTQQGRVKIVGQSHFSHKLIDVQRSEASSSELHN